MTKAQFLTHLRYGLNQLPEEEIEKQLSYYSELIDDMCEDGMTEQEAVERMGSVQEIYENILREQPLPLLVKTRARPREGWTALTVILAVLGFPLWFFLAAMALAVLAAVYVSIWACVIAAFSIVLGIALCAVLFLVLFVRLIFTAVPAAVLALGLALLLAGLALLACVLAVGCTKLIIRATAAIGRGVKSIFIRKEH